MASIAQVLLSRQSKVCVLRPHDTVAEAVALLASRETGALLVIHGGSLVGVFSERDLLRRVVAQGRDPRLTLLGEVMTRRVVTATPDEDRLIAVAKMRSAGCCHLPVLVGEAVIDVLSMGDLLDDEIAERAAEVDQLRQYICGS